MKQASLTRLSAGELFENIRTVLEEGYDASFTVTGNSMWPTLASGRDRVVLRRTDAPLKKGQIVLFMPAPGQYVLHRVYRVRKEKFYTCGDGNCFRDGGFSPETVLAVAVRLERKNRKIACNTVRFWLYSRVWLGLYFMRPWLLKRLRKLAQSRK